MPELDWRAGLAGWTGGLGWGGGTGGERNACGRVGQMTKILLTLFIYIVYKFLNRQKDR
jgi:hypothetical protein